MLQICKVNSLNPKPQNLNPEPESVFKDLGYPARVPQTQNAGKDRANLCPKTLAASRAQLRMGEAVCLGFRGLGFRETIRDYPGFTCSQYPTFFSVSRYANPELLRSSDQPHATLLGFPLMTLMKMEPLGDGGL